jgi:HlyD family secretion protein
MRLRKLIFFLLCIGLFACKSKVVNEVSTTLVKRGTFTEELTEEGTVRAINSINITAPTISYRYGGLKITNIVPDGKEVNKGDTILVFDPSEIKKAIIDAEQKLEIANAEYEKLKATQQSEIEDLESDYEISSISQEISKINFEQSVYESDITKKEIRLKLETANIALSRAKEQIENRKKIQQEDLYQKTLSIKQLMTLLDEANSSIKNLFVLSPAPGIAIIEQNWMTRQKWGVSDQPYSGTKVIELPDLNEMMAIVNINEVDVSKILPGMKVLITPDAYSDSTLSGKVTSVANLAQNKEYDSKIKIFPVQIKIDGKSKNLMPGLTVSCKILINEVTDTVFIPIIAVFKDQGSEFVYVKSGSGFNRRNIKVGASNTDFVIVSEGLSGNEEIALNDPFLNKEDKNKNVSNGNGK